ncbi:MAG: cytochrome c biogenesis protein CcdA [Pseudomonadota bacterium]
MPDAYMYFGVALAGLVSFLSPCVLPLVPPYLGYLGGTTISQVGGKPQIEAHVRRRIIVGSLFFVLGFTAVFVSLGAGASAFGQLIREHKETLSMVAGGVIILFGLHFLGVLRVPLLYKQARYEADVSAATYVGAFVMGLAFAFGWTPCIGPILGTVMTVAASEGSLSAGMTLLLAYSLGLGVPFVLAAVAIGPFLGFMGSFKRHLVTVERVMGVVLILTGLMFLTGWINVFGTWMLETFPGLEQIEALLTPDDLQQKILEQR